MAKTKKIDVNDPVDGIVNGSKANEIFNWVSGCVDFKTGKGNDRIVINKDVGQEDIFFSTVNIGKGEGTTTIALADEMRESLNSSNQSFLPRINFQDGAVLSYKIETTNKSSCLKKMNEFFKWMTKSIQAQLKGKNPPAMPKSIQGFNFEDASNHYDIIITAKWGKKTSTLKLEDFCENHNGVVSPYSYLKNDFLKVAVGENGAVESITDKLANGEIYLNISGVQFSNTLLKNYENAEMLYMDLKLKEKIDDINNSSGKTDEEKKDAIAQAKEEIEEEKQEISAEFGMIKMMKASYSGTDYNDIIDASKGGMVNAGEGDNIIYTAKKGKVATIEAGSGNDTYIINSIRGITEISEEGSKTGGGNNFHFKGTNGNDFYATIMPRALDGNVAEFMESPSILFTDSKGIQSYTKLNVDMNNIATMVSEVSKLSGLNLGGKYNLDFFGDGGVITQNSEFVIEGKASKGAGSIDYNDLQYLLKSEFYGLKEWWNKDGNGSYFDDLLGNDSLNTFYVLGDKALKQMAKAKGLTNKKDINAFIKEYKAKKQEFLNIYKYYHLGTSGNNSYTIKKSGGYFRSGFGNDTFTFKGKLSNAKLDKNGDPDIQYTDIYSRSHTYEADKLVFKNYSFENGDLSLDGNPFDFYIKAFDYDKNRKLVGEHDVYYETATDDPNDLYKLSIKDKKRTYNMSLKNDSTDIDLTTKNESNKNHIIYQLDTSADIINIKSNGKYNIINSIYDNINYLNTNKNTHDYLLLAEGSDSVEIEQYNKNTTLFAQDGYSKYYGEGDDAGDDIFKIQMSDKDLKNLRFIFNIDQNGSADFSKICMADKSKLTASNIYTNNDLDGYALKTGITLTNFERVTINHSNIIETIADGSLVTLNNTWLNELKEKVSAWLSNHDAYSSSDMVFDSGNTKDINSLLAVYKGVEYNMSNVQY